MTITEALEAMNEAAKAGYNIELVINGEYYEVKPIPARDVIAIEVLRTK